MAAPTQIGALTDFTPNTTIQSAQVDANFSAIRTQFNALIGSNGQAFIGDDSNANNTFGLTVNQLAADDHALTLKSSDVATGITTMFTPNVETDDFFVVNKLSATLGGANLIALAEDAATSGVLRLHAIGGTADTTKSTAGRSLCEVYVAEHNASNAFANVTADGNIFGVRAYVGGADVTRWMVDEDGDTWQAGSLTTVGALLPNANDGAAIGVSGTAWSDLFLASGAVINFDAGDVLLTHSANNLALSGGTFTVAGLAGVGTRNVVVDANGVMSAP